MQCGQEADAEMLVLLLAEGEEAGSAGAVGGGVAPEEEGLASSLLMLGYGELQFDTVWRVRKVKTCRLPGFQG